MTKKLAVFDWNGTLIDDSHANWEAGNTCLAHFGKGPISYDHYRETMDFPVLHVYTRNGVDADTYLANFQTAGLSFLTRYKELAASMPLRRGTTDLLDWLLQEGYDLMVLSNFLQPELEAQMAQRHVLQYFKHISGNIAFNELEHSRTTKRERLEATLKAYDPAQSFIIGDSLEEPEIARHYGLKAFSVTWGCFAPHRLEKGGTDHLIDELAEVSEILQKQQVKG